MAMFVSWLVPMALVNKAEDRPRGVLSNPPIRQPGSPVERAKAREAGKIDAIGRPI
jgi:hypothetical protein